MSLPTANESKINDAEQQPPDIIFDSIYTSMNTIKIYFFCVWSILINLQKICLFNV